MMAWFLQLGVERQLQLVAAGLVLLPLCVAMGKWLWGRYARPHLAKRRLRRRWRERSGIPAGAYPAGE